MIDISFVKLYFSSNTNYVQFKHINLDIKFPVIPSTPRVRLPNRQCYAFLQERTQNAVKRLKKKSHVWSWEGAPKTCASIHPRRKWRRSPKNLNLLISDAPEIKWVG